MGSRSAISSVPTSLTCSPLSVLQRRLRRRRWRLLYCPLHIFVMVAFTLVLFAMTYDYDGKAELSRIEGAALLIAFIAYDTYVVMQSVKIAQ